MAFTRTTSWLAAFVLTVAAEAGTVTTKDGQGYTGLVQFADAEHLTVGPLKGPGKLIALKDVVSATFDAPVDPKMFAKGAPMAGKGFGLLGAYHDRPNFKGRVSYRLDKTINHQWYANKPVFDLPRDYFSIRWTGELEAPVTGEYTFTLMANDGAQLTVGTNTLGKLETMAGFRQKTKMQLQGGKRVPFQLEFFDNYGEASARVLWKGPGFQEGPIAATQLYPVSPKAPEGLKDGPGLLGSYFQNRFFYGDAVLRVDRSMDFKPVQPPKAFPDKNYSVRWTGQLEAPHTEEFTFQVTTDEGVRLWVGGKLVINSLSNRTERTFTGIVDLQRGARYNVRLESVHRAGQGNLKATWSSRNQPVAVLGGPRMRPVFEPPVPEASAGEELNESQTLGVFSWGGSRIAGRVTSADDTSVRFEAGTMPGRISTVNVARIVFKPVPRQWREKLRQKRKGVLLQNGEFIEGDFQQFKDDWFTIHSLLFGVKQYGTEQVMALVLGEVAAKPVKSTLYELVLEDGSLFHVRSFKLAQTSVRVDDPTVGKFNVPLTDLDELRAISR